MPYDTLLTRRLDGVEYLTLNRPEVRNAFNETMLTELADWAAQIAHDAAVDAVVLTGAGPAFAAGADAAWMARAITWSHDENLHDARRVSRMFAAIDQLPVPVIASVHGAALGGGAGLAAVCDVVVADEAAMFGFTEVRLGIVPAVISPFVLAKIGQSAARELFLTGARFSAARAREIGLVHAIAPSHEIEAVVARYVADVRSGGREAIATAKRLIDGVASASSIDAAELLTTRAIAERRVSEEGQEGLRAFLEKRKPAWVRG